MVRIVKENVRITAQHNTIGDFGRIQFVSKKLLKHVGKTAEVTVTVSD